MLILKQTESETKFCFLPKLMLDHGWCSAQSTGLIGFTLMELMVARGYTVASSHCITIPLHHILVPCPAIPSHSIPSSSMPCQPCSAPSHLAPCSPEGRVQPGAQSMLCTFQLQPRSDFSFQTLKFRKQKSKHCIINGDKNVHSSSVHPLPFTKHMLIGGKHHLSLTRLVKSDVPYGEHKAPAATRAGRQHPARSTAGPRADVHNRKRAEGVRWALLHEQSPPDKAEQLVNPGGCCRPQLKAHVEERLEDPRQQKIKSGRNLLHALHLERFTSEKHEPVDVSSKLSFSSKTLSTRAIFQQPVDTSRTTHHFQQVTCSLNDSKAPPGLRLYL
ncbi:uncharacterized protein LOC110400437 [Numida meleagris]|uniref:uncharacterized protein LOC110400437 n=1 Tax=Numida meleagris TaxID=8996 RepID=UPI000B3E36BB|nr:uncharacterized protein LOC110400437 [Numida meleagris]